MFRYFLSWRYLANRRTNLIGIIGILLAVGALILILSIMTGFLEQHRKTVRGSLADLIVHPGQSERAGANSDPSALLELIRSDSRVQAASARLIWVCLMGKGGADALATQAMLSNPLHGDLGVVQVCGIDFADESATTSLAEDLRRTPIEGALVADANDPFAPPPNHVEDGRPVPRALIGDQLFGRLGLARGEVITISTLIPDTKSGELATSNKDFMVAGTFRSGENEMDLERVYVERTALAEYLRSGIAYSEVLVRVHDYERDGAALKSELRSKLRQQGFLGPFDGNVFTWEDFRHTLLRAIENERVLMAIMLSLVLVVAGFTIFAILSMMVTEKRRDIGILTALGATPAGVMQLFLLIAFWDALIGALVGAAIGTWAALKIDVIERWLSSTFGIEIFDRSVYYFDTIPSFVQPVWVATIVLGAFLATLMFAAIPAWRAARMEPLEALRYE